MPEGTHFDDHSIAETDGGQPPAPAAGDAGGSFLDMVNGKAPIDPVQAKAFREESQQIKTMADNGDFSVNEIGGTHAKRAAQIFLDGYAKNKDRLLFLKEGPALGNSPYAQQVREHVKKVIDGDEQSLIPVLDDIEAGFKLRIAAIDIAMRNYQESESENKETLRKMSTEK